MDMMESLNIIDKDDNNNNKSDNTKRGLESSSSTTTTTTTTKQTNFKNDGLFSWMKPFLDLFGYVEGNTVYNGVGVSMDKSNSSNSDNSDIEDIPSLEVQIERRKEAEENMMNIGMVERMRRGQAGEIAYKAVFGYGILSSIFLDDGSIGGSLARFAIILPLFFATGYTKSAETGL
jgi:hypothetical protein